MCSIIWPSELEAHFKAEIGWAFFLSSSSSNINKRVHSSNIPMGSHLVFVIKKRTLSDYSKTNSKRGQSVCACVCVCLYTRVKVSMHLFVAPAAMSIAISIVLTLSHFGFHLTLSNLIVISVHGRCSLHRKSSISLLLFSWPVTFYDCSCCFFLPSISISMDSSGRCILVWPFGCIYSSFFSPWFLVLLHQ